MSCSSVSMGLALELPLIPTPADADDYMRICMEPVPTFPCTLNHSTHSDEIIR